MVRQFSKVWLVAMVLAGAVASGPYWAGGGLWTVYWASMAFVGALIWVMFFIVQALSPWIDK